MGRFVIYVLILFMLAGCGSKLHIRTLYPSSVDTSFKNIKVVRFVNDDIFQTEYIKDELFNKTIDGKKIFNLNSEKSDVGLVGKVLKSSLSIETKYKEDKKNCILYAKENNKTKCLKYYTYPCEEQRYDVQTHIKLLAPNKKVLFSKIYKKFKNQKKCYKYGLYEVDFNRDKYKINPELALEIAKDVAYDLSPRYKNFYVTIIEEFDDKNNFYTKYHKNAFKKAVDLMSSNIHLATQAFLKLDHRVDGQSVEVLYNLALCFENNQEFRQAYNTYIKARNLCKNQEHCELIEQGLIRVKQNSNAKQKALRQIR